VESTAEDTADRVISPIFYASLASFFSLGATIVWIYKTINILDRMVGYKMTNTGISAGQRQSLTTL